MRRHCWWHWHRWGINTMWPGSSPGRVRWERHCTRCGTALTFTGQPFLWGLDIKARRAAARAAKTEGAASMSTDTERRRIADQAEEVEQARLRLADTIRNACPGDHRYVQHRDGMRPWCPDCGYTAAGGLVRQEPSGTMRG